MAELQRRTFLQILAGAVSAITGRNPIDVLSQSLPSQVGSVIDIFDTNPLAWKLYCLGADISGIWKSAEGLSEENSYSYIAKILLKVGQDFVAIPQAELDEALPLLPDERRKMVERAIRILKDPSRLLAEFRRHVVENLPDSINKKEFQENLWRHDKFLLQTRNQLPTEDPEALRWAAAWEKDVSPDKLSLAAMRHRTHTRQFD